MLNQSERRLDRSPRPGASNVASQTARALFHLRESLLRGEFAPGERMSPQDLRSRKIIEAMKTDEAAHGAKATQIGGKPLPRMIRSAMKLTSRLMTRGSFWL